MIYSQEKGGYMERSEYIRVSEILGRLRDKSHINPVVFSEKGLVGTEVHHAIAEEKTGGFPMFSQYAVRHPKTGDILLDSDGNERREKKGIGYFKSFSEWDRKHEPIYEILEQRYYCDDLKITGQIDALVKIKSTHHLIDFKTSYKEDLEIWTMQAHFYWYLLHINGYQNLDADFQWIKLHKNGEYPEVFPFRFDRKVLSRCFEEAKKALEERTGNLMLTEIHV